MASSGMVVWSGEVYVCVCVEGLVTCGGIVMLVIGVSVLVGGGVIRGGELLSWQRWNDAGDGVCIGSSCCFIVP